jgi:hypothetical protein
MRGIVIASVLVRLVSRTIDQNRKGSKERTDDTSAERRRV